VSPDSRVEQAEQQPGIEPLPGRASVIGPSREGEPAVLRRAVRLVALVAFAGVLLVVVRLVLVQSFVIPTTSMQPTLLAGDRVLVSRWDYRIGDVHRGDVIVFDGDGVFDAAQPVPASTLGRLGRTVASALGAPVGEHDYAKRVIGLPGDHVVCCDVGGRLTVNGTPLVESYLPVGTVASTERFDIVVSAGRLWVMGDNRNDSADSRAHLGDPGGGTVPLDHVVGRVVAVWWPFTRITGVGSVDATRTTSTR
jgi:signal peptidase I